MRRYDSYVFDWKRVAQSLLYLVVSIALFPLGSARYKIKPRTNHQPRFGGVSFSRKSKKNRIGGMPIQRQKVLVDPI
jgi:hypothetical protein